MPLLYTDITNSEAIRRIGYNTITQELHIEFNKRKQYPEYVWGGIPKELSLDFLTARSKGKFYHARIKDKTAFRVGKPLGSYKLGAIGRRIRNIFSRRK